MEELVTGAVEETAPAVQKWYEGVSLEDAEIYIQANLKSAARSVIAIGYYLKCVHRNELFKEAGYKDICEYAKDRFGFSASTTSRYMTRNDKFSVNGNSPILDEKYKDFNKSQLQEMLSLDAEQLEKVTPDMTVVQIREMKKPKEIPYIAIPGQIELTDLPGVEPEDVAAAAQARKEMVAGSPERQAYTISAEDLLPQDEPDSGKETIAISQQDSGPEVIHFTAGDRTIDGAYGATIAAVVRKYLDSGYARPEKECEVAALGLTYKVLKRQDITVFYTDTGRTAFDIQNARLEEEYQYWHGTKAEPEPAKPTRSEAEQDSCPPGITDCRRQEWGTGSAEQEAGKKECKACWASWKRQHKALGAGAVELDAAKMQQDKPEQSEEKLPDPDEKWSIGELPQAKESLVRQLARILVQECGNELRMTPGELGCPSDDTIRKQTDMLMLSKNGFAVLPDGVEAYPSKDMIEFFRGDEDLGVCSHARFATQVRRALEDADRAILAGNKSLKSKDAVQEPDTAENVIDSEFTEILEPQMTELQIAQEELERAKKLLNDGLKCDVDENDIHIRRLKLKVCALASYVCDLEQIENPPPEPKQPELPLLKNNDQRAAFIDNFETWPLWIETKQTGERYYRYDLEDGTSMVVKVYHAMLFDWKSDERYREGYGRHEYYLLRDGKFFRDCETNRGLLIEKLKEIQKPKKEKSEGKIIE